MTAVLSLLGLGALVGWGSLPLLAHFARLGAREATPAARCRLLLLGLVLSAGLLLAPAALSLRPAADPVTSAVAAAGVVPRGLQAQARQAAQAALPSLALLGGLWIVLALGGLARLAARTGQVLWIAAGRAPVPPAVTEATALLAQELGVEVPRVVVSPRASLPFVMALPTTTVVLPQALVEGLAEAELALVLRHELIHLARRDHLGALLLELLKLPFAFHPAATRLCAEMGLAREMAVDARIGAVAPRAYAHLLVDVAELHRFGTREAGEVALEPSSLERRIAMLTAVRSFRRARYLPILALGVALTGVCALLPVPRADAGSDEDEEGVKSALRLKAGETRTLSFGKQIARLAIGKPEILDVRPEGNRSIKAVGVKPGTTTLLVWFADGSQRRVVTVTVQ